MCVCIYIYIYPIPEKEIEAEMERGEQGGIMVSKCQTIKYSI